MMIQMHNKRNNAIGLDQDLEVVEVESKERNGRNDKKKLKNHVFNFAWTCEKFAQTCEMDQEGILATTKWEKWKLISHNHAKRSKKTKMVLMDFPLRTIVRNCWSSCEIASFPYFLMKKPPEDLLDDVKCPLDLSL